MNRNLLLQYADRPVCLCLTFGEVQEEIQRRPTDMGPKFTVWRVYHREHREQPTDCTAEVAEYWAKQVHPTQNNSRIAFEASFPPFVRTHGMKAIQDLFSRRVA